MKTENKIVIIGGTACGPKTAARARRCDPHAKITIIEQSEYLSSATCGFPYYVGGTIQKRTSLDVMKPELFKSAYNIDVFTQTRAVEINRREQNVRVVHVASGESRFLGYDKLVIATGSLPIQLSCEGYQLGGIYPLWTMLDAINVRRLVDQRKIKKAVVVGSGLIGMEVAEGLVAQGLRVTMIDALDWLLPKLLDFEIAAYAEKHLKKQDVDLLWGARVIRFEGQDGWVKKVVTDRHAIDADLVILAIGTRPNVALAEDAGIEIGTLGGISVNSILQTNDPNIYAGGDCVENIHRITLKKTLAPMGSTANKHGRIIGTNIAGGQETFPGVLGTTVAKAFDYNIGRVGLTESQAISEGYSIETCLAPGLDHAAYYPGAKKMLLKLIVDRKTRMLLGAQGVGEGEVAKRIDVLATAISFCAKIEDVADLDLGYAPPYNSAMDPVHHAANVIRNKLSGMAEASTPMEVKRRIDGGEEFVLLDVRSFKEKENCFIDAAKQTRLIPLPDLRTRLEEIPKEAEIVIYCQTSIRAYRAQRILTAEGFRNVKFMDGSMAAWPYEALGVKPYADQSGLPIALETGI